MRLLRILTQSQFGMTKMTCCSSEHQIANFGQRSNNIYDMKACMSYTTYRLLHPKQSQHLELKSETMWRLLVEIYTYLAHVAEKKWVLFQQTFTNSLPLM